MTIFGKVIGALLGFFVGGWIGAALGLLAGHFFDRGLHQALRFDYAGEREAIEKQFFETVFSVMGALAKADGRISEQEIQKAELSMTAMGLSSEHRRRAIDLFKAGAAPDFALEPCIAAFNTVCGKRQPLKILLLEYLIGIALADDELHEAERDILLRVSGYIGLSQRQFEQLLAMHLAQQQFQRQAHEDYQRRQHGEAPRQRSRAALDDAYRALGVSPDDDDKTIKRAYRKLMSEHHPDKLIAQGVPEDMVQMATEKSQEVQTAYDMIKRARAGK